MNVPWKSGNKWSHLSHGIVPCCEPDFRPWHKEKELKQSLLDAQSWCDKIKSVLKQGDHSTNSWGTDTKKEPWRSWQNIWKSNENTPVPEKILETEGENTWKVSGAHTVPERHFIPISQPRQAHNSHYSEQSNQNVLASAVGNES
jgi:hypothetical protein